MSPQQTSLEQTISFDKSPSFQTLLHLAQHPYDLTQVGALGSDRIATLVAQACGFKLIYATEKVDKKVLEALQGLAREREALQKMTQMQAGEIINCIHGFPSENRAALHTALRDQFDKHQTTPTALEARNKAKEQLNKLKKFLLEIDSESRFQHLIVIAIGGSQLGPKSCYEALLPLKKQERHVYFVSNVDPDDAASILHTVPLKNALVAVVSKSGTTLETLTNEKFFRSAFEKEGIDSNRHFIAVTGEGSPMDNLQDYRAVFHMWDWVGGRYSSTSTVGGVPLGFAYGFDVFMDFLHGAHEMDQAALSTDLHTNIPLLAALLGIWNRNCLKAQTLAVIPYSNGLASFYSHLQQLDMESNGKRVDKGGNQVEFDTGPILWGSVGTNAQHSFFQLLHQGTTQVPIEFIGFTESQYGLDIEVEGTNSQQKLLANLLAQIISLATGQANTNPNKQFPGNTPSSLLLAKKLTPFQLGALLAYYEHKVAFQGFIWNINSFDQEGVQLGKVVAQRLIEKQKIPSSNKQEDLVGDAYLRHIKDF